MSSLLPLLLVFGLAALGGWMLAASLFRLRRAEMAITGLAFGLLIQNWATNLLAHWLDLSLAAWLAAFAVLLAGALAAWRTRSFAQLRGILLAWRTWLILVLLALVFFGTSRGLGLFDDYQNLPVTSMLAAGDIPPHFPLDPSLRFGYHYFLLLLAAQIMRLGATFPWIALDAAHTLTISLNLVLAGLWAWRVTRSRLATLATGFIVTFAGGARWILLLLPASILSAISSHIPLIGTSSLLAKDLVSALLSPWNVEGAGPIPFPFAYTSGVNLPLIMSFGGSGSMGGLILLLLLLTATRWRHWTAAIPTTILLAACAFAYDAGYGMIGLGFALMTVVWVVRNRSLKLPRPLWTWLTMLAASFALALVQGGMFTELLISKLRSQADSYFSVRASLVFPPVIVSGHFGPLSLGDPAQLFVALLESGPLILLLPFILWQGWKSLRRERWFEAGLIAAAALAVPAMFVTLKGRDLTASSRFLSGMFFTTTLYAIPMLWFWARKRGDGWRIALLTGGFVATLSGLLLFGIQLIAIQRPVYGPFLNALDAQMASRYWDKLEPDALIFDATPSRAPTVFGRFTSSSFTWYIPKPDWRALRDDLDPFRVRAAGYDYIYMDGDYWSRLTPEEKDALGSSCVKVTADVEGLPSPDDHTIDFRRLYDIRACQ
jgi:hypothetical protein